MPRKKHKKSRGRTSEQTRSGKQPRTELPGEGVLFTADHAEKMTAVHVRDLAQQSASDTEGIDTVVAEPKRLGHTRKHALLARLAEDWKVFRSTDTDITQELIQNCTFEELVGALRKGDAQRVASLQKERE